MAKYKVEHKKITVTSAGTPVQVFTSETLSPSVLVQALFTNSGRVHVGDSDVDSSSELGVALPAGAGVEFEGAQANGVDEDVDMSTIWIDALNDDDAVIVSYYERLDD